jgi:hypothetical protein
MVTMKRQYEALNEVKLVRFFFLENMKLLELATLCFQVIFPIILSAR